jgi:hypothetical protein
MKKSLILTIIILVVIIFMATPCETECKTNDVQPEVIKTVEAEQNPSKYTEYELNLLARLINAEAGSSWLTDEHQRAVASVVLNRIADPRFPNTMHSVIYQKGQYACTWNGMISIAPSQRAIDNAKYVLENGVTIPENVIFQAQFKQGKGVWKYIQGHYFCY